MKVPKTRPSGYAASRREFSATVGKLVRRSANLGGTPSRNGRQYWSSILAAKLALTAITLDRIMPRTAAPGTDDLWDLSSIAALVRVVAENYLLLHWLCVETEDADLWQFRITAMTLVDNRSRYRLTEEVEGTPEPDVFVTAQKDLGDHLAKTQAYHALPASQQREVLKGAKLPFIHDDVVEQLGLDHENFRRFYRYLSAFVHTGTVSFFRVEEHARCNGEFNTYEAGAVQSCMEFASLLISRTVRDLRAIHREDG